MRIGIFGGTFDPPHIGHRCGADAAAAALGLDRLFVIPNATPPHKELPGNAALVGDRLLMTRIAFRSAAIAEILDVELRRGGRSYTVDTATEIKERYPEAELFLLMGTDMFVTLTEWHDWQRLLTLVTPVVFSRGEGDGRRIADYSARLLGSAGIITEVVRNDALDISSSELRAALPLRGGRRYLDGEVYAYIIAHRLYGVRPDYDWLREQAYAMLRPKRVPHVKGCEEEAERLAVRWGADVESAREAAILHDITKKLNLDEQLLLCERYGIINDNVEKRELKLLHAKTGAEIARDRFGVSDEVYNAVRWHTTGRAGMTLLEKIVYLADYIEPTRIFDGVDELRRLCNEDLDEALILGLEMSIEDIRQRGTVPHEKTLEALAYMLTEKKGNR